MTKSKKTKRALLSSAMALLLCFTMLLGTTFAWFTDSATSGRNTIQSGNLDMKVSYKPYGAENTTWTEIDSATEIFGKDAKYEPGYTEAVWIKVENEGSLAFRYQMTLDVKSETAGKTKDNEDINLSEHLVVSSTPSTDIAGFESFFTTRESLASSALTEAGKLTDGSIILANNGVVLPNTDTAASAPLYYLVVINMPTTVGNEANHNGTNIPKIDFGITALATQVPYEEDSFGIDYDANAEYPTVINYDYVVSSSDELVEAFANGGTIKLESDIKLDGVLDVQSGAEVYLDMNGKTISANDASVDPVFYTHKDSKLTIDGNGTVELGEPSMSLIIPGGDVVIENGNFIRNVPEGTPANQVGALFVGVKVSPWGSQSVVINGGYFDGGYYDTNAADIEGILAGNVTFIETEDDIAKRGNSKDANQTRVALKNNIQLTLNLSYNLMKVYGGTFVGMNPAWGDEGCMLPTNPNYLRPWSYYQGALLDGQQFNEDGIVLPEGYTITEGTTEDGRPTYTVNYSK